MGFISVLIIIVCILLVIIVLVQNSKGGGLASNFASNNQVMGVRRTADFLEKATWGLAIALFVFALLATPKRAGTTDGTETTGTESVTRKKAEGIVAPAPVNNTPATNPAAQPKK